MEISSLSALFSAPQTAKAAASPPKPDQAGNAEFAAQPSAPGEEAAKTAATAASTQPGREQIGQAVQQMQRSLPSMARNLQFSLDEETGRTVVKVVDTDTNEVIRQIPSEEALAIAQTLDKESTGLLLKQKA